MRKIGWLCHDEPSLLHNLNAEEMIAVRKIAKIRKIMLSVLCCGQIAACGCYAEICESDRPSILETAAYSTNSVELLILMYHSVKNGIESDYSVTPETLKSDLSYLRENGYTSVTPEELVQFVYDGKELAEKPVLITFDDGFYNNLAYALPLLEEYNFTAVVNIVGEFTEQIAPVDCHVPTYSYLTAEDCAVLLASGRVTLGNHTNEFHHRESRQGCAILPCEQESRYHALLWSDLTHLQDFLTSELSFTPIVFAYPYGFDCPESVPVLRDLGFLLTLTCYEFTNHIVQGDEDCLYGLGRYNRVGNMSTADFFHRISS